MVIYDVLLNSAQMAGWLVFSVGNVVLILGRAPRSLVE